MSETKTVVRARAVKWKYGAVHDLSAPGRWGWMCCNCGSSPGFGDLSRICFNCKAELYAGDVPNAKPTEAECLAIQVHRLRWHLRIEKRLARAVAECSITGQMPKGYSKDWPNRLALMTDEDIENAQVMTEHWTALQDLPGTV
jgi:hypothetical protein